VTKAGGKGKVSNELVAASCAAVLSVYAVGYWRTRDEAQRFETRAQERRPARTEQAAAAETEPAAIESVAPTTTPTLTPISPPDTPPTMPPPKQAATTAPATAVAAELSSKTAAVAPAPQIALPQPTLAPTVEASVAAVAVTDTIKPDSAELPGPDALPAPSAIWRDGTYTGWGTSRHGDIKAQVVIRNGRIVESGIASCETRYPCDVISAIIHQPVDRQAADVDRVSRATESVDAYYYGLVDALAQALVQPSAEATTLR
jgi:uncharacterized protein with FMN-binding domain